MRSIVVPLELTVRLVAGEKVVECSTILKPVIFDELHDGVDPTFKHVATSCSNDLRNTCRVWRLSVHTSLQFYAAHAIVNHYLMKGVTLKLCLRYFKLRFLNA